MSKQHGTVVICVRQHNGTVAWVDDTLSKEMPAGYFIEVTEGRRGMPDMVRVGTLDGGYASLAQIAQQIPVYGVVLTFGEAVRWCWHDQRKGKAA